MSEYFTKRKSLGRKLKVEFDLPNYKKKVDLKKATSFDTSDFAKKADLASLKLDFDELDIDQL